MYTQCAQPSEDCSPKILQDYTSTSVETIRGHSMLHSAHGPNTWRAQLLERRAPQAGAGTQATRLETA
jgi:hypothetical protein